MLWSEVKGQLTSLRRAEHIRKRRKGNESQHSKFLKDPFKMARSLLEEIKRGTLVMPKEDLEAHMRRQMEDTRRDHPLGSPGRVPQPTAPTT